METATLEAQITFCEVQSALSTDPALRVQAAARLAILEAQLAELESIFN